MIVPNFMAKTSPIVRAQRLLQFRGVAVELRRARDARLTKVGPWAKSWGKW